MKPGVPREPKPYEIEPPPSIPDLAGRSRRLPPREQLEQRKLQLEIELLEKRVDVETPAMHNKLRAEKAALEVVILELHPTDRQPIQDGDGYTTGEAKNCPTCKTSAPCETRLAVTGGRGDDDQ